GINNKDYHHDRTNGYLEDNDVHSLNRSLRKVGLYCKDMAGDGNCMFRALADQIDGTSDTYSRIRARVCEYMAAHPDEFAPFVEDNVPWDRYLALMRAPGTFGGNLELVAFARNFRVDVKVYQAGARIFIAASPDGNSTITDTSLAETRDLPPNSKEKMVMHSTGVTDLALVRRLLTKYEGNPNPVIDELIEQVIEDPSMLDDTSKGYTDGDPVADDSLKSSGRDKGSEEDSNGSKREGDENKDKKRRDKPKHVPARERKAMAKKRQKAAAKLKKMKQGGGSDLPQSPTNSGVHGLSELYI
ncbi:2-oxoglutarate dehydrogenase E1 component, partial [Spiromyces aspiralis]